MGSQINLLGLNGKMVNQIMQEYQLKTKIILLIILQECTKHLHVTVTIQC